MADVARPNVGVATLVRTGLVRVPARYRPWLVQELSSAAARRRIAVAGLLPGAVAFTVTWLLLGALMDSGRPIAVTVVAAMVGGLLLGLFGFGYDRQIRILRAKNRLTADPG